MLHDIDSAESQLRSLENRKINIESQLNDLGLEEKKLQELQLQRELLLRRKRKDLARIKMEIDTILEQDKKQKADAFEVGEQIKALKKQLNSLLSEIRQTKIKLSQLE